VEKDKIGFFKVNTNSIMHKTCKSQQGVEISSVTYDLSSPGVIVALSSKQNVIQIFEAKGKGEQFQCSLKGVIKAPSSELKIKQVVLQPGNNVMISTFVNSNQVAMIQYAPKNMVQTLLKKQNALALHLKDLLPSEIDTVYAADSTIMVMHQGHITMLENQFKSTNFGKTAKKDLKKDDQPSIWRKLADPANLMRLLVPLTVILVLVY